MAQKHQQSHNISFSLGGHRSVTAFIVIVILFVAVCVFFVNKVVISKNDDPDYRSTAENKSSLINFDTSVLQKAQALAVNANNTSLPTNTRVNPFRE